MTDCALQCHCWPRQHLSYELAACRTLISRRIGGTYPAGASVAEPERHPSFPLQMPRSAFNSNCQRVVNSIFMFYFHLCSFLFLVCFGECFAWLPLRFVCLIFECNISVFFFLRFFSASSLIIVLEERLLLLFCLCWQFVGFFCVLPLNSYKFMSVNSVVNQFLMHFH